MPWIVQHRMFYSAALAIAAAVLFGCARPSPEERIEELRSQYTVELTSFTIDDRPIESLPPGEGGAGAEEPATPEPTPAAGEEATGDEAATDGTATPPAGVPTRTDVVLDILVGTEASESLDGLTVEFEQVGTDGTVKDQRQLWLDVSKIARGSGAQITHVVEDVDYQEGDGFAVSIRSPVPPDERDAYREFQGGDAGVAGN